MTSNSIVEARILLDGVKTATSGAATSQIRAKKTFEADVSGSGAVSATVVFEGSNAGRHWEPLGTLTLSGTGSASGALFHDGPWAAVRATVTEISAGATLTAAIGF